MPKVKEKFATGDITPAHLNALANAAGKVGAPLAVATGRRATDAPSSIPRPPL